MRGLCKQLIGKIKPDAIAVSLTKVPPVIQLTEPQGRLRHARVKAGTLAPAVGAPLRPVNPTPSPPPLVHRPQGMRVRPDGPQLISQMVGPSAGEGQAQGRACGAFWGAGAALTCGTGRVLPQDESGHALTIQHAAFLALTRACYTHTRARAHASTHAPPPGLWPQVSKYLIIDCSVLMGANIAEEVARGGLTENDFVMAAKVDAIDKDDLISKKPPPE